MNEFQDVAETSVDVLITCLLSTVCQILSFDFTRYLHPDTVQQKTSVLWTPAQSNVIDNVGDGQLL